MTDREYSHQLTEYCDLRVTNGRWIAALYTNITLPELPVAPRDLSEQLRACRLESRQQEFILCNICESKLQMSRLSPRVITRLTQGYSGYSPQPLKYCDCKATALLVDHRCTPRIYSDGPWQLVVQPLGYERRYSESELEYQYIPKGILENMRRPKLLPPASASRLFLESNGLVLRDINQSAQLSYIISPKQTSRYHSPHMEHYIRYAYTYKIIIITTYIIYLPSGIYLTTDHPKVKAVLDEPYGDRTIWFALIGPRDPVQNTQQNQHLAYLNEKLSAVFDLPVVPLSFYPSQAIGYLPLQTPKWDVWEDQGKCLATQSTINQLELLKSYIRRISEQISFCKSDVVMLSLWVRDNLNPRVLLIPPLNSYLASKRLNPMYTLNA